MNGNLVSFKTAVNDCFLSKTANYCRKRLNDALRTRAVLFPPFSFPVNCAAVSSGCGSVFAAEVAHEVSVGSNPNLFQNLLDGEKRRAQHPFRSDQPDVFDVLGRSRSSFLFKQMAKARGRQVYERCESGSIPRRGGVFFYL